MRNRTRSSQIAGTLLLALLIAGCAASPGELAHTENVLNREIAGGMSPEPAGITLVDTDGNAASVDGPAVIDPAAAVGRRAPVVDPDAPVSSGQLTPMPAPDTPLPSRPVGSGSGGASGGGSAGMEPGVVHPTAPAGEARDMPLLYCGEDQNRHGEGRDLQARECLWDAYVSNRAAAFRTVAYTVEGDPITYAVDALQRDRIQVLIDSEDNFGAEGQFLYTCTAMEFADDSGFVLKGCAPSEPDRDRAFLTENGELHIP